MTLAWTIVPAPDPIRALTVVVSEVGVCAVIFGAAGVGADGSRLAAVADRLDAPLVGDRERTDPAAGQLTEYLAGDRTTFTVPLDWRLTSGTRHTVLRTLYDGVGYGETVTYGELAARSGAFEGAGHAAARGVGSIMGSNPIPVIVPCHRVLAAGPGGWALGGFGGGRATKEWLLALEGVLTPALDFGTS